MPIRSGSASATHKVAAHRRERGVGFSFGFPVTERVRQAVDIMARAAVPAHFDGMNVWYEATETGGTVRDGAG